MSGSGAGFSLLENDVERLILGSILLHPQGMEAMRGTLELDDFGLQRHRQIWSAACDLYDSGGELDAVTTAIELKKRGHIGVDGITYLSSLTDGLPVLPCLDKYVDILKNKTLMRRIVTLTSAFQERALSGVESGEELRVAMSQSLAEIAETSTADRRPISTTEMVDQLGIDEIVNPVRVEGLRMPWDRLNRTLNGLRAGQIVIWAGDTGKGKTSGALQIATHAAKQGKSTLYWTMEMPPKSLFRRMLTQMTGVDRRNSTPTFDQREQERLAVGVLHETPVFFDSKSRTVPAFCAALRSVRQKARIGLVVVDYLQLIRGTGRQESRTREVGENSRSLKLAAMDFALPFLVLSQYHRPKDGQRPTIHSLKESGDIENDADVILMLIANELSGEQPTPVALNVGKQREGPAGFDIPLIFHPTSQSFQSAEE